MFVKPLLKITMTKTLLLFFSILLTVPAIAQVDTSAYGAQRSKINALLADRSIKFGQYEESLNERTGIFGFQTKDDIRNSNEILRQITLNDNNIFKELKVLLDYKDLQVQQVQNAASTNSERIRSYMAAIKKLQDQNQLLRKQLEEQDKKGSSSFLPVLLILLLIAAAGYFAYYKIRNTASLAEPKI
jgi:peptidoglycan hydrolase CwlO-like protein